jgi:hypothetical protein
MQAAFLDLDSLNPLDLDLTPLQRLNLDWRFYDHTGLGQIIEHAVNATIIITNKVPIDRSALKHLPALRLISVAATGTNNVDLVAASDQGIVVSNARNYATASVAEHVFAMLLTLYRQLGSYRQRVAAGDWMRSPHFCLFDNTIEELHGKILGIVGYGTLGRAVAQRARAFGMQVMIAQRLYGEPVSGRFAAALPIQTRLFRKAIHGHISNAKSFRDPSLDSFTGLAIFNPNSAETIIQVEVFDQLGGRVGDVSIPLKAKQRISKTLVELVPASEGLVGGYIQLTSTLPVAAQQLFGNLGLDYLSAVLPTIVE